MRTYVRHKRRSQILTFPQGVIGPVHLSGRTPDLGKFKIRIEDGELNINLQVAVMTVVRSANSIHYLWLTL